MPARKLLRNDNFLQNIPSGSYEIELDISVEMRSENRLTFFVKANHAILLAKKIVPKHI